jgi:hypothetical protein
LECGLFCQEPMPNRASTSGMISSCHIIPYGPLARPVLFAAHLLRHDLFVLVEAAFELAAWREDLHDPYGPWARVKEGVGYAPRLDDVGAFLGEHDLAAYTARSSQSHVSTRTV